MEWSVPGLVELAHLNQPCGGLVVVDVTVRVSESIGRRPGEITVRDTEFSGNG